MIQLKAMWEPGSVRTARGTDPQKVADEIFSISDTPTTDEIVEMASDPETESWKLFDWDNEVAGRKWRKEQARQVMRVLKVTFVNDEHEPEEPIRTIQPVRMFYGNPDGSEGFTSIVKIMENKDMYAQLLDSAKCELQAFRKKYNMLKELGPIFEMIDTL